MATQSHPTTDAQIHEDDLRALHDAHMQRDRMRSKAEDCYINLVVHQEIHDEAMRENYTKPSELTYTTSQMKEMLLTIMRVGGVDDEFIQERAGELDG